MKHSVLLCLLSSFCFAAFSQSKLKKAAFFGDVQVTIDEPLSLLHNQETLLILYALPNGNSTEQTMGKRLREGDDWRFDIQHIAAQTAFLRNEMPAKNIVVAYLENAYKSWPQWKTKHPMYADEVHHLVDTLFGLYKGQKSLYLNGHSGGGRFIFSYLDAVQHIPPFVKNISFLDSDYGYDSTYLPKLTNWLAHNKTARLNVFAYNDSVALLNGKRFVSDTGGTWYRSGLMLRHLSAKMNFRRQRNDSLINWTSTNGQVHFFFKANPAQLIYHTVQVERNGFIHSVLAGTKNDEKRYRYFGERAYLPYIR